MNRIKKDDLVVVIAGKDKDKQGRVISVDTKKNKVLAQGCNMVTKHTRQAPGKPRGGIVNQEAPTDISNAMLVIDGKAARVGSKGEDGKKVRVVKITDKAIDQFRRRGKNVGQIKRTISERDGRCSDEKIWI